MSILIIFKIIGVLLLFILLLFLLLLLLLLFVPIRYELSAEKTAPEEISDTVETAETAGGEKAPEKKESRGLRAELRAGWLLRLLRFRADFQEGTLSWRLRLFWLTLAEEGGDASEYRQGKETAKTGNRKDAPEYRHRKDNAERGDRKDAAKAGSRKDAPGFGQEGDAEDGEGDASEEA